MVRAHAGLDSLPRTNLAEPLPGLRTATMQSLMSCWMERMLGQGAPAKDGLNARQQKLLSSRECMCEQTIDPLTMSCSLDIQAAQTIHTMESVNAHISLLQYTCHN